LERFPESRLEPLSPSGLVNLKTRFPDIPEHLLAFFEIIGCGCIGRSRYMIYDLIDAGEIFGKRPAADLEGIVLVGDDFAGCHEAYATRAEWRFGKVGGAGRFEPHVSYANFIDFIEDWFVKY
jgi:hypothetical protein